MKTYLVLFVLLFTSCSAQWHVKKARKKDPTIFVTTTTVEVDTVTIETLKIDTAFIQVRDSVIEYIQKDNLGGDIKIRYRWNTKTDTVEIQVDCPDQKIITEETITTETVFVEPTKVEQMKNLWWVFILIFIGAIIVGLKIRRN